MSCEKNTNQNPVSFTPPAQGSCMPAGCGNNASQIIYTGPGLLCIDEPTNTDLQTIIQKIDSTICSMSGTDWSMFNYNCLDDATPITTPEIFVDNITNYVCTLRADLDTFIGTTYTTNVSATDARLDALEIPAVTASCAKLLIPDGSTNVQVLNAMIGGICDLYAGIDLSTVNWDLCFTVITPPTTIAGGFDLVVDQICQLKADINSFTPTLPPINNAGSCLPLGGPSDSWYDTLIWTRDLLCTKPSFDIDNVIWAGCIPNPLPNTGTIEDALTGIVAKLNDAYSKRIIDFSTDFVITQKTPGNTCSGFHVALSPTLGASDRMVALDVNDPTSDFLMNKIAAGTGITLDTATTPGKVTFTSAVKDEKLKADATDTNPAGYLSGKVEGSQDPSNALALNISFNPSTNKVKFSNTINYATLVNQILSTIANNPNLLNQFCAISCGCDCTSTTTTVAPESAPMVSFEIFNGSSFDAYMGVKVTHDGATGSVTWYDNTSFTLRPGQKIVTGSYPVTGSLIQAPFPPLITAPSYTGAITIYNNSQTDQTLNYIVNVFDNQGVQIPSASYVIDSVVAQMNKVMSPFGFGDKQVMIVKITV